MNQWLGLYIGIWHGLFLGEVFNFISVKL